MALKWQHAKRALELVVAIVVVVAAVAVVITANVYILDTHASSEFYNLPLSLYCCFCIPSASYYSLANGSISPTNIFFQTLASQIVLLTQ